MLTWNEAYHRARLASEKIREDVYRAADQLAADAVVRRKRRFSTRPKAKCLAKDFFDSVT